MDYMMVIVYRCLCRFGMVSHQIVMIDTNFVHDVCSTEKIISRVEQHLAICFMVSIFRTPIYNATIAEFCHYLASCCSVTSHLNSAAGPFQIFTSV